MSSLFIVSEGTMQSAGDETMSYLVLDSGLLEFKPVKIDAPTATVTNL